MAGLNRRSGVQSKYTVYRLGNNKGFRVVGQISQDLDLFRMPVTLRIVPTAKPKRRKLMLSARTPHSQLKLLADLAALWWIPITAC